MRAAGEGAFSLATRRAQVYAGFTLAAALVLPFVLRDAAAPDPQRSPWLTVALLLTVSVLNIEVGRAFAGGLSRAPQPHKALSAWAFACGLLLPPPWLLLVVPLIYAHARWRGLRVSLWKWTTSGAVLVLCGLLAGLVAHEVFGSGPDGTNWMNGNGGRGLIAISAAALAFLVLEGLLLVAMAYLNHAEDEAWLRRTLAGASFYLTELGVLVIGGLLCAVWTGGAWFVLLFAPIYTLAQRAALHEPLSASNQELSASNRFKVDLMGMLGHEIGNPLTAVLGHAQVGGEALDEADASQARRSLTIIERNAGQIRNVLHDILALVSSESGELDARPEPCPVARHLQLAVAALPPARQPEVQCPDELWARVQPGHLDQILANLLGNADKYAGGASRVEAAVDASGLVEICVTDQGPGVPASLRSELFQRFSRGQDTSTTVAGTGLGLFITRELAHANGGDVGYRPGDPIGSVFVLSLAEAVRPG